MEPNEKPLYHDPLPFDLSILTDKEKHAGFFCILFLSDGRIQAHYDKMDSNKFGHVVTAIMDTAITQDIRNIDNLVAYLKQMKADLIKRNSEAVFEEVETKPLTKLEDEVIDVSKQVDKP